MSKTLVGAFLALYVASIVFMFSTQVPANARAEGLVLWVGGLTLGLFIMAYRERNRQRRLTV